MLVLKKKLKVLDFDIENRPLTYWTEKEPTSQITAIAAGWSDDWTSVRVWLLGEMEVPEILENFVALYNEADIVTGHYIRLHDLPTINGALMEHQMPQLTPKLVQDTKTDMYKKRGIPATQEFLGDVLDLPFPKVPMTQKKWRLANRLTPEGIEATRRRASGDVLQHMTLRTRMIQLGLLKTPSVWRP